MDIGVIIFLRGLEEEKNFEMSQNMIKVKLVRLPVKTLKKNWHVLVEILQHNTTIK